MCPHFVYIIFAASAVYVGRTKNLIQRMQNHGMLGCDWAVLEVSTSENIREREAYWVKYFLDLGCDILNCEKDCSRPGILGHNAKTRQKIGKAHRGKPTGRIPWNKGKKCPEISETLRGNKNGIGAIHIRANEWRQRQILAHKGKRYSPASEFKTGPSREHQLEAAHIRWHTNRDLVKSQCSLCQGEK